MKNKIINKSNKYVIIAFIIILTIQTVAIFYAASKRQWFHMDELTTYGLIQYHNTFLFKMKIFLILGIIQIILKII